MKLITTIAIVAVVSTSAVAEIHTATGVGSTAEAAIANAKHNALADNGEVVISTQRYQKGKFDHEIESYVSGAARVLEQSVHCDGGVCEATVTVDVDPRKMKAVVVGDEQDVVDITSEAEKYANVQRMGQRFDDVKKALMSSEHTITPSFINGKVRLAIVASVRLNPQWVDDVQLWSAHAGTEIDTSMPISDMLWIAGTATAPFNVIGSSVVRSIANHSRPKARVYSNTNCFSSNRGVDVNHCYAVGHMMGNVVSRDRWNVTVRLLDINGNIVKDMPIAVQNRDRLFLLHDENSEIRFPTSGKQRKFSSRGVVWFTDGVATSDVTTYDIPIDIWQRVNTSTTFFQ